MKTNYTLIFIKESIGYSVSVLELSGCLSEGDTRKEALENIKEAIGLYLEGMTDIAKIKSKNNANVSLSKLTYEYETV